MKRTSKLRGLWLSFLAWGSMATVGIAQSPEISETAVREAQSLLGLDFTSSERSLMLPSLERHRQDYHALRQFPLSNGVAPALVFDPIPRNFRFESRQNPLRWTKYSAAKLDATGDNLAFATVGELGALLRARVVTSEQLTRLALERLHRFNPTLKCVVTFLDTSAMATARQLDLELRSGKDRGPLHGIPYGAKDLLAVKGIPTTWGAAPYTNQVFDFDAAVVQRLQQAGAVLVAKLTLGELAMGDTWFGGMTRNPWNPVAGSSGSSAGSASAVSAGLVPFAIGTETVGSIVSPSTVCGTTGLRPTFGRVSRAGAMALAWSSDKIGPMARSAEDCARVFSVLHGADPADPVSRSLPFNYDARRKLKGLRIGYLRADIESGELNRTNNLATLEVLRQLGATVIPIEIPKFPIRQMMWIIDVEAAAAFDSLTRSNADDQLAQQGAGNWPNIFRAARFIPAVEYVQANRVRQSLIESVAKVFESIDALVAPPWEGRSIQWSNLTGHPSVVVPNGIKSGSNAASITFIGKLYGEGTILEIAKAYQQATSYHQQRPPLKGEK